MLDVSIIIITYRMREMLREVMHSILQRSTGFTYEMIVVENASEDGTLEMLHAEFPDAIVIANTENRGVAPARNQGFAIAHGRYVVTLDADMIFLDNALKVLADFMDAHPRTGLAGCTLVSTEGEIQPSARRTPTALTFLLRRLSFIGVVRNSRALRWHEMTEWDRQDTRPVDYVIGACQFIRREAMDQIGPLDEHIFYGPEDLDYCLRMRMAGWEVWFVSGTRIVHYEQRITKRKLLSRLTWLHFKGILYLFRKYRWKLPA
jgi:GT2 family glycosyltransferase